MQQTMECAHPLCNCTVEGGPREEAYCSDTCRDQEENEIEDEVCACGHPQCDVS